MPSTNLHRILIVGLVSGAAALGCQAVTVPTEVLTNAPVVRASVAAKRTPEPTGFTGPIPKPDRAVKTAGVAGSVDLDGKALANADVKLYLPGAATPLAAGKTDADGRFSMAIGVIATGGGNVIATGGGNVISVGGGNVISTGGGNAIASGAPLKVIASKDGASLATIASAGVIATGGGNVIATGGGNVIATGGGNVIATGGGNYRVAQASASPSPTPSPTATPTPAPTNEAKLTLATTMTVLSLGADLEKAMAAAASGEKLDSAKARSVFAAFQQVHEVAESSLASASAADRTSLAKVIDSKGKVDTAAVAGLQSLMDTLATAAETAQQTLKEVASTPKATPAPTLPPESPDPSPTPPSPSPSAQTQEFPVFGNSFATGWSQNGATVMPTAGFNGTAALAIAYGGPEELFAIENVLGNFDASPYGSLRVSLKASTAMKVYLGFKSEGELIGTPVAIDVPTGEFKTSTHTFSSLGVTSAGLTNIAIVLKSTAGPATLYLDNLVFLP